MAGMAIVSYVGKQVIDISKTKFMLLVGVDDEICKLGETFDHLQTFLNDAEQRQMSDVRVSKWLQDLKNVAYEMEDVLDEWRTEMLRKQLDEGEHDEGANPKNHEVLPRWCSVFSCLENPWVSSTLFSCFNTINKFHTTSLRNKIGSRIKEIRDKVDSINRAKDEFKFNDTIREDSYFHERMETSSITVEQNIWGRDNDKKIILNKLLGIESSTKHHENLIGDPLIISIIGMGGLGKTTLAQLVYNHDSVRTHFQLPIWVCVSQPFDRIKIAKAIIFEATGKNADGQTWNALHTQLCKSVQGKKFLLVLDDVWTEDSNRWEELKHLLTQGAEGSRILVTTRNENVASMMNSCNYKLEVLSPEDSSSMLHRKAFSGKYLSEGNEVLKEIVVNISKKCNGLPLALSLLGSLLNKKIDENRWRHISENKIWELKLFNPPALVLSYDGLSPTLKTCFAHCAVFPKNHKMKKRTLIKLWMAQGFLNSTDEIGSLEFIGEKYFDELLACSFFQKISGDEFSSQVYCKMHDLIHDFAEFLTGNHCQIAYTADDTFCVKQNDTPIHLTFIHNSQNVVASSSFHNLVGKVDNVRTVLSIKQYWNVQLGNLSNDLIPHLKFLRVLKLKKMGVTQLPDEIDKLIHLRYLDLSRNEGLKELPESLCSLFNLQTLKLKFCKHLHELPEGMSRMVNLRNFNVSGTGIDSLPEGIENWKSLKMLSTFIVSGATEARQIKELRVYNLLQDSLELKGLGRLRSTEEITEAELWKNNRLRVLRLDFKPCEEIHAPASSGGAVIQQSPEAAEVLEVLRPHSNSKKMTIGNYPGIKFPSWMGDVKALTNLRFLELYKCSNCVELPALGLLPSLEELLIKDLNNLKRIGVEIYGGGDQYVAEVAFPKLITLEIAGTKNLEVWEFGNGAAQVAEMMPRVINITLDGCEKLIALPSLNKLPSLELLRIEHANQLTSISLESYCIRSNSVSSRGGIRQLENFTSFPKLSILDICYMKNLEVIFLGMITEGKNEDIDNEIVMMPCLLNLIIEECPELKSFRFLTKSQPSVEKSDHLENLKEIKFGGEADEDLSLCNRFLTLKKCPKLNSFPRHFPSLSCLSLVSCPSLISKDHRSFLPISPNLTVLYLMEVSYKSPTVHLGDVARFKELQRLWLRANLDESSKSIPEYLQNLTKLQFLSIENISGVCEGGDWSLLSHINYIDINNKKINPLTYSASSEASSSSNQISLPHHPGLC
ncbi:hypothetical protein MKW94_027375 [Papaver nudicaule]|uniref:Uncharacterized protein n=1 Tax=Papaver nudicaule TaxID=74823 RepID=A0AA41VGA8_PAPNU|nr:hypothetical protein [Papaver nudicaule]